MIAGYDSNKSGFTLISLLVVTVLVVLLTFALFPAVSNALFRAKMNRVGAGARGVYVAIVGANTEREPLGLPSLWPCERPPLTNELGEVVEYYDFDSSTDYFRYLNGDYPGCPTKVSQRFDYACLSGCGVPPAQDGVLLPENNMWTIAKNVRDEMEDILPIMVTRNVDSESLPTDLYFNYNKKTDEPLRFNPLWEHPFGNKGAVFIRKGGGMFMARSKYMTTAVIYNGYSCSKVVLREPVLPIKYISPLSKEERDKRLGNHRVNR